MTEVQGVEMLEKLDALLGIAADTLAVNQQDALTSVFLCGLIMAGFLALLILGGFK